MHTMEEVYQCVCGYVAVHSPPSPHRSSLLDINSPMPWAGTIDLFEAMIRSELGLFSFNIQMQTSISRQASEEKAEEFHYCYNRNSCSNSD